jgi:hypothetical protein
MTNMDVKTWLFFNHSLSYSGSFRPTPTLFRCFEVPYML